MTLPYNATGLDIDDAGPPASQPAQDMLPHGERGQDEQRSTVAHDLTSFPARPLTSEEEHASEHDTSPGERVYAPAEARVAKPPVSGHRDLIEHPDARTPERRAAGWTDESPEGVVRTTRGRRRVRIPLGSSAREQESDTLREFAGVGVAWGGLFVCGAVGMWLYLRWQQARNRPVNRLRRQARWAASEVRERLPETPEGSPVAVSAAAALVSTGLVIWRRLHTDDDQRPEHYARRANRYAARAMREVRPERMPRHVERRVDATWQPRRAASRFQRWLPERVDARAKLSVKR
jgi:hypothetical protein